MILQRGQEKPKLFWGPVPILNFKYWNDAMKMAGFDSKSIMTDYYASINKKEDFDLYIDEIPVPKNFRFFKRFLTRFPNLKNIYRIFYIADHFDILHISFEGAILKDTEYWAEELDFYKRCRIKIVALPYGSDYQMYSKLYNKSWHHALLINYPAAVHNEARIQNKVTYLANNADFIMAGFQFDQIPRWDIFPYAIYPMDCNLWSPKKNYSMNNGVNGSVKVYHTPNHKAIKGSEFLIKAVDELKEEGLLIDLILLEKVPNNEVRKKLQEDADILVEQLILGFALSAIEGMSVGLPVISNLEEENETRVFRRFSYLNECPILSANPEKIKKVLKSLVTNPELRLQLGKAGIEYAKKYHSLEAMGEIFTDIYAKIWYKKEVDLINYFNPNFKESYNNRYSKVNHPLIENRLSDNNTIL